VFVFGAAALVAFASAVYFGTSGRAQLDSLHRCAPGCSPSDVTALKVDMIVTDVSLGVGVVASAVATWLFLTRPAAATPMASASYPALSW
jgi:hypothetical protein